MKLLSAAIVVAAAAAPSFAARIHREDAAANVADDKDGETQIKKLGRRLQGKGKGMSSSMSMTSSMTGKGKGMSSSMSSMSMSSMSMSSMSMSSMSSSMGMGPMGMGPMGMGRERTLRANPGIDLKVPPLSESYTFNSILAEHKWESFDLDSFSDALQCDAIAYENRPIHDASTWRQLRQTYEDVVGSERSSITLASRGIDAEGSFIAPFAAEESTLLDVQEIPGKGRGLVATRDIKEGEPLWSDVYLAAFHEKTDLNRFLAVLPTKLACDIILWTYHIEDEDDVNFFYFSVDLDLGTFCNDGGIENTNIEWKAGQHVDTATAARPIAKGEEILCDYEDYEEEDDEDDNEEED